MTAPETLPPQVPLHVTGALCLGGRGGKRGLYRVVGKIKSTVGLEAQS